MFKKFIQRLIDAESKEYIVNNIFYGADGIDMAYQKGKITYKEYEMLSNLIDKMIDDRRMIRR